MSNPEYFNPVGRPGFEPFTPDCHLKPFIPLREVFEPFIFKAPTEFPLDDTEFPLDDTEFPLDDTEFPRPDDKIRS